MTHATRSPTQFRLELAPLQITEVAGRSNIGCPIDTPNRKDAEQGSVPPFGTAKKLSYPNSWPHYRVTLDIKRSAAIKEVGRHKEARIEEFRNFLEFPIGESGFMIKSSSSLVHSAVGVSCAALDVLISRTF
jgi:hypothetical protein